MKLKLAIITAVLAVSTTVAQAADTRTPDILGSVSAGSVQALGKAESEKARGQYFACYRSSCSRIRSYWKLREFSYGSFSLREAEGYDGPYYISR